MNKVLVLKVGHSFFSDPDSIKFSVAKYCEDHFSHISSTSLLDVQFFVKIISSQDKTWLERLFTEGEILTAPNACDGNKSPGPDRFNLNFFGKFWNLLKSDIVKMFNKLLRQVVLIQS